MCSYSLIHIKIVMGVRLHIPPIESKRKKVIYLTVLHLWMVDSVAITWQLPQLVASAMWLLVALPSWQHNQ